ncbi:DUF3854 domain-containing protein [Calothrix sp. CCY 0018]|uniref:DUF3854 domain-containing protein n=1 Tax=Calothrix sp. CCY 0018 TaxID=3103864 RepID=UPI0039C5B567
MSESTKHLNNLTPSQYQELAIDSAIHPALIAANFKHIAGVTAYEYLFISKDLPRTNPGKITSGYLKRYAHAEHGGLWISGLDPHNKWKPMEWGRFKPTYPRIDEKGRFVKYESPPKTPNRVTYFDVPDCIWDKVAKRYGIKRYNSPLALRLRDRLHPLNFWEWVLAHPEIPIILCEGEKKAAALLSLGFVAIALPGIWNGRVGKKDFDERLHPDLLPLAQPGRKFQILFDHETKFKTRWAVFQATIRTGKAVEAVKSATGDNPRGELHVKCQCEVITLPGPEKGVDDFASARKKDADVLLTAIINDARLLDDYRRSFHISHRGLSSKYKPHVRVNVKYLSDAIKLPLSGLVVLSSDMGTGKTELMRKWRLEHPNVKFLNNGHRVNLLKNLSERLQTDMYSSLSYGDLAKAKALSITIDSLHKLNTEALEYGCVFIDEACQYLTHLLTSKTCREYRAQILEVLEYIVYNAQLVVIADAHMDDITVDFFRAIRPQGEEPLIFVNDWRNGGRVVHWYEGKDSSSLVAQISSALMTGQKIMVVADSKKFIKKLEKSLLMSMRVEVSEEEAGGRGLLAGGAGGEINSDEASGASRTVSQRRVSHSDVTSGDGASGAEVVESANNSSDQKLTPDVPRRISQENATGAKAKGFLAGDFGQGETSPTPPLPHSPTPLRIWSIHSDNSGSKENVAFIKDITNSVKDVDALLASPSLGTGVDIPNYHFDAVYGAFHGVSQTATECAQQLYRYRPKVPFHIWVAPRPPFGYKDTNANKIKERLLQTNQLTAFLIRIDRETGKRGAEKDWALDAFCQIEAKRNRSMNNLRTDLRELLTEMGNQIIPMGAEDDKETAERLKDAAAALAIAYNTGVVEAKDISAKEYRSYRSKDYLNPEEMLSCEKFRIKDAYGMEITEELVARDDKGKLIKSIINLEAILSETDGVITDDKTGRQHPAPPKIVTEKDHSERLHYPLCMDWGNYSAKWQARFFLGLDKMLKRLINGERITAKDPELLRMTKLAEQMGQHIKAILGFTVPENSEPIWLLGLLLEQLGLKLDDDKPGARGKQVKHHFLDAEKLEFALSVIEHRENKRQRKEERARQDAESQRRYQAGREAQYGVAPPPDPVSTPPPNGIGNSPLRGVDTTANNGVNLEKSDNSSPIYEVGGDWEPNDGDSTPIRTSLAMLREAIVGGVEAVLATICRWTCDLLAAALRYRRWCAVLLLEEVAEGELRKLEQMIPSFYAWLGEFAS